MHTEGTIRKKKKRLRFVAFLLLVSASVNRAGAQIAFTWEQIRDKFKQTNPTLLSDAVNIDEARAEEITAYLRPNPNLALFADQFTVFKTPNTPYRPFSGVDEGGAVSYLHERQHKRELRREAAQEGTSIAESTHEDLERNLLFTLRTAFVNALQAKASFELARQEVEYWDKEIVISRQRLKAGDLAKVDLDRIVLQRASLLPRLFAYSRLSPSPAVKRRLARRTRARAPYPRPFSLISTPVTLRWITEANLNSPRRESSPVGRS